MLCICAMYEGWTGGKSSPPHIPLCLLPGFLYFFHIIIYISQSNFEFFYILKYHKIHVLYIFFCKGIHTCQLLSVSAFIGKGEGVGVIAMWWHFLHTVHLHFSNQSSWQQFMSCNKSKETRNLMYLPACRAVAGAKEAIPV